MRKAVIDFVRCNDLLISLALHLCNVAVVSTRAFVARAIFAYPVEAKRKLEINRFEFDQKKVWFGKVSFLKSVTSNTSI